MPSLEVPQRLSTDDFVTTHGQTSGTFKQPPLDGSLNLPMMVEWHAEHSPQHTWAVYPKPDGTLQHITWKHLAHATENILVGVLRAGYTAFLISPRNAKSGVVHLLKVTDTVGIIGSSDRTEKTLIDAVRAENHLPIAEAPLFDDLFDLHDDPVSCFSPSLNTLQSDFDSSETALIIHSSGSTGFPKPIPLSHLGVLQWARIPCYGHHDLCGKRIGIQSAPPFHGMGFFHVLGYPLACGSHVACFPPQEPPVRPTPERVLEAWKNTGVQIGTGPPSNLVEWSKDPEAVRFLTTLEWLRTGGGPLPTPIGNALVAQGVRLLNGWGTTEVGVLSQPAPKEPYGKDWEYIQVTRNAKPIFEKHGDNAYEICFPCTPTHYPSVFNDTENWIYRTSDLVEMHPTEPGFFKVVGRADDQLMLSTGEKTNPGPLENVIKGNILVDNIIYFGRGRFYNGILVQPSSGQEIDVTDDADVAKYRNAIWPSVSQANDIAPTHSRIFKEMILIASREKPLPLTPKGTISRPRALELYANEIDAIYEAVESSANSGIALPRSISLESLSRYVQDLVTGVMRPDGGELDVEKDIFLQGCDSLQATMIRNRLLATLRSEGKDVKNIPANWVYLNSTLPLLSASFYQIFTSSFQARSASEIMKEKVDLLNKTESEYIRRLKSSKKAAVILTGSTGTLGCYLLQELVRDLDVGTIYAVNRPSSETGPERQRSALIKRGIDPDILSNDRVMHKSVELIIHNAWRLDFNLGLNSFKPNMDGVVNLINFALTSPLQEHPRIFNTSSISVLSAHPTGWVAEATADPRFVAPTGYGQSKYIGEKLLEAAPLTTCSIRIGQLSGSTTNGAWNVTDWLPMLVKSSKVCGGLPAGKEDIAWFPVDKAAQIIIELTKAQTVPPILHLAHPRPIKWDTFVNRMAKNLDVPVIPFDTWIQRMSSPEASDQSLNPAVKILGFFKARPLTEGTPGREAAGIPRVETKLAESHSPTLAKASSLTVADFDRMYEYWRGENFFS
ncbi:acetyl-CoA synthetase-like protein [Penicillium pulvis]|uniref:acetyl-CoA synthetase-like protein n=1 Tax=Penicillium pulvis TaxID=1562058 RepID=UPI00254924CC|nr:acetyl-CoA synthetase-like protein [Penicillium pulvis]KAJ5805816.1 acetyl-CoA synthetase-like protein [Penicillium pulvis]